MEDVQQFAGVRLGPGTPYGAIPRRGGVQRRPHTITPTGRAWLTEQLASLETVVNTAARR
jgi:hypothetical protein